MHRQTIYRGQVPYETDILYGSRFAYEALGLLAADVLGTSTLAGGFACTPTSPTSLAVKVGPGRLYTFVNLDPTAWGQVNSVGGLDADTNADHNILKQGLFRDTTTFSFATPSTPGQSINYLIEAAFQETDSGPTILPFYNASNPLSPYYGSANNGQPLNTARQDKALVQVKAGTAATTGSQTTPSPDSGYVSLYVITVPYGATFLNSSNITVAPGAPFITETLQQKIGTPEGDVRYRRLGPPFEVFVGASYTYAATDTNKTMQRSNSGAMMFDTLPGTGTAIMAAGWECVIENVDASLLAISPGTGTQLNGVANNVFYLGPGQSITVVSDGTNYYARGRTGKCKLQANLILFVSLGGSDFNHGLTSSAPFATLQGAWNALLYEFHLNGFSITIQMGDGTHSIGMHCSGLPDGYLDKSSTILIIGHSGDPTRVIFTPTNDHCFEVANGCKIHLQYITLGTGGSGSWHCLYAHHHGTIYHANMRFTTCVANHHHAEIFGYIQIDATYTIIGGCVNHHFLRHHGFIYHSVSLVVTISGSQNFSGAFCWGDFVSTIDVSLVTYTGSGTGKRHNADKNCVIFTNGGGANFFPGNSAGSVANGAQFL